MGSALARSQYPSGRYPYFFLDLGETTRGGVPYCITILILLPVVSGHWTLPEILTH
ncbi:MAG TPA: hypothetical protein VNB87_09580 [Propionibacteriaceae bacterium]|nr:hypothetical protein [Propionibacteriaceae bacterium]